MQQRRRYAAAVLALALILSGTSARAQERTAPSVGADPLVRLVDTLELDPRRFDKAFGGISGIAYDALQARWLLLSDDRSDHAPARFYTARIARDADGRWRLGRERRVALRDARGAVFPRAGSGREAVDPEAIRVAPDGRSLAWSSEGDANHGYGPTVRRMDRRGRAIAGVALPANLGLDPAGKRGPPTNGALEGLDFAPDGALWLAMEAPLIEDGLPAGDGRAALVRFTRISAGGPVRQFAYRLDAAPPPGFGKDAVNGVTEILMLDDRRVLVIERWGETAAGGQFLFHCRLYLADFTAATDVSSAIGLDAGGVVPATKLLLLDFGDLPGSFGNLEGMAWWPSSDGRRNQIVVINDNNFVPGEATRLHLLALSSDVLGPPSP